jgi:hypothetical protein
MTLFSMRNGYALLTPLSWILRNQPCNSNMRDNSISSKATQQAPLRPSVPIEWKSFSKKVILVLFPNSIPFNPLRHPLCILASNIYSHITRPFLPLPMYFLLLVVSLIIPFLSYQEIFLPMFALIIMPFPRRMELIKLFKNCLKHVLSVLLPSPILLMWSWYSIKKALGAFFPIFVPSTNSPS